MAKNRSDDTGEKHTGLLKLMQILSFLVVFVGGIIIGISGSAHMDRYVRSPADFFSINDTSSRSSSGAPCVSVVEHPPCEKADPLRFENFTHPNTRTHYMTDEQLFWRASMSPLREGYPFRRVPKLAFMFLTRGPLPLLPIWERFFKHNEGFFSIYLHGPPNFVLNVSESSVFYRKEIPSKDVQWGDISLVDAERRLLANALLDHSNDRFILLSESCIPIFNFRIVYDYLIHSDESFVEAYDDPSRYGRGRYNRRMHPEITLRHWRKGSQWFEVQREVAIFIVSDDKYYDLFRRYCKPACYPDEHYIATFLNMFHGGRNSNRTVTWVDWSIMAPHPATYQGENVTQELMFSIRKNATKCVYNSEKTSLCYLFARKFAPSALEPLLQLSSSLFRF